MHRKQHGIQAGGNAAEENVSTNKENDIDDDQIIHCATDLIDEDAINHF
jgi:hypothetical protein